MKLYDNKMQLITLGANHTDKICIKIKSYKTISCCNLQQQEFLLVKDDSTTNYFKNLVLMLTEIVEAKIGLNPGCMLQVFPLLHNHYCLRKNDEFLQPRVACQEAAMMTDTTCLHELFYLSRKIMIYYDITLYDMM